MKKVLSGFLQKVGLGKTVYEVTDEEQRSIKAQINQIIKTIYAEQEKAIPHYIVSRAQHLAEMNKNTPMILLRGRMLHEQPAYRGPVEKQNEENNNWNKRILQLSKAGEISYYEDEDKEKKNEATFRFSLSGYTVSEDANAAENARNRSIAKWFGITDLSVIPYVKNSTPLVFELTSDSRRIWRFKPENFIIKQEWVKNVRCAISNLEAIPRDWAYTRSFQRGAQNQIQAQHLDASKISLNQDEEEVIFAIARPWIEETIYKQKYLLLTGSFEDKVVQFNSIHTAVFKYMRDYIGEQCKGFRDRINDKKREAEEIVQKNDVKYVLDQFKSLKNLIGGQDDEIEEKKGKGKEKQKIKKKAPKDLHIKQIKQDLLKKDDMISIFYAVYQPLQDCFANISQRLEKCFNALITRYQDPKVPGIAGKLPPSSSLPKSVGPDGIVDGIIVDPNALVKPVVRICTEYTELTSLHEGCAVVCNRLIQLRDTGRSFLIQVKQTSSIKSSPQTPISATPPKLTPNQTSSKTSLHESSSQQGSPLLQGINLDDQVIVLKRKAVAMLMRGICTLGAQIRKSMNEEGSKLLSQVVATVFDRFQYDAKVLIRRITLDFLHLALDPPFIREGMDYMLKTKLAAATQQIPANLITLFKIDLIIEDVLRQIAEKRYIHQLQGKLHDLPTDPDHGPLKSFTDADEDLLWTFY
ncbi:MAG: hypothetical protein EZS28_010138 [Streblomastix strix]|uniref:PH domain-containing protein n=1 Tax=Streblomastix strix TaxID=222440 RepID=A0A5J4WJ69_9EUKA|nr:MAG: hypothetical protein EZS28_010138 [Streblomastix strix]